MTRYVVRLVVIAAVIVTVPVVIVVLGYSATAATLGAVLTAALTWVPTLLALEGIARARRPDTFAPRVATRSAAEVDAYLEGQDGG